jgi:hypothetical protein
LEEDVGAAKQDGGDDDTDEARFHDCTLNFRRGGQFLGRSPGKAEFQRKECAYSATAAARACRGPTSWLWLGIGRPLRLPQRLSQLP